MLEKLKSTMSNLGFQLKEVIEDTYWFDYEGCHLLMVYHERDKYFLQFMAPCILERDQVSSDKYIELMKQFNSKFKYVKCYETNDCLSLYYERDLGDVKDLESVIEHIIQWLAMSVVQAGMMIEKVLEECEDGECDPAESVNDDEDK